VYQSASKTIKVHSVGDVKTPKIRAELFFCFARRTRAPRASSTALRFLNRRRLMRFWETIEQHFRRALVSKRILSRARGSSHEMGAGAIVKRAIEIASTEMSDGARAVLKRAASAGSPPALGAAAHAALVRAGKIRESVLWCYSDRLKTFAPWWRQLWAESLGKNGKGTTPVAALGPVDQHSQLQLFIAGPRDKLITVITTAAKGRGPRIAADLARLCGEDDLADRTMGDLAAAEGRATAETLARNGCPVRAIEVATLDESSLGELLMHFMLETIIAARLLGVDPFDQPAVEEGKVLAKKYLAGGG